MKPQHAIIIGSTGLVGSHLLNLMLEDARFEKVTVLGRRACGVVHKKITEHIINFDRYDEWKNLVKGDVVYLCLGTTRAKAGGKQQQYKVDHKYQHIVAAAAAQNNVRTIVLVSSAGAREGSPFFYTRMKAELEHDILKLPFESMIFIRPGALTGPRNEKRHMENFGVWVIRQVNKFGIARNYRPIHANTVAKAMISATFKNIKGSEIYELNEVFALADETPMSNNPTIR